MTGNLAKFCIFASGCDAACRLPRSRSQNFGFYAAFMATLLLQVGKPKVQGRMDAESAAARRPGVCVRVPPWLPGCVSASLPVPVHTATFLERPSDACPRH